MVALEAAAVLFRTNAVSTAIVVAHSFLPAVGIDEIQQSHQQYRQHRFIYQHLIVVLNSVVADVLLYYDMW